LLNPTLAPSKLVKSSCELSPCFKGWDGGLSSTPSLMRCLQSLINFFRNSRSHSHTH
jgi:hypothetical protein